ncbi:MAG: diguanylate cyclase [Oleiphilaceae bacterium]
MTWLTLAYFKNAIIPAPGTVVTASGFFYNYQLGKSMDSAIHYDDYAQAIKYLKMVLPAMAHLKIPTTPENYSVWYEYTTGKNPSLVKKIDALKAENREFTQTVNDNLYEIFIAKRPQLSIHKLNASVKSVIDNLLAQIQREDQGLNGYSESLEMLTHQVTSIAQLSDLETLISKLVSEAHTRNKENEAFRFKIKEMSKEVEDLDKRLKRVAIDANTDALTGIYNRRAFNQKLSEELADKKKNLSIIMIDIDHFKRLNDTYGHLTGDKVLKFVASLIGKNIRGQDYLARFGGEEFVIILPDTPLEKALCVANNIRSYLSKQKLYDSSNDEQLGCLTLSMGVSFRTATDNTEKLIGRADKCLYLAKSQGRNKAICQNELSEISLLN